MFFDLGVYGVPRLVKQKRLDEYDPVVHMRQMEKFIHDVGGMPFLYADTCMTRKEFHKVNGIRRAAVSEGSHVSPAPYITYTFILSDDGLHINYIQIYAHSI